MGYDVTRFTSPVNDGLLCSICRDVLEDALQAPCEHAYCFTCIGTWLAHENTCPDDRQPLHVNELRPLFRYMQNQLDDLQIRCVNEPDGCPVVHSLGLAEQHEGQCQYAKLQCPNAGCTVVLNRQALDEHRQQCPLRRLRCPNGCGLELSDSDDDDATPPHNCVSELRESLDQLREQTTRRLEEQRLENELRLDTQRRFMLQRETTLKLELNELREIVLRLTGDIKTLLQAQQRCEHSGLDRAELVDILTTLQLE